MPAPVLNGLDEAQVAKAAQSLLKYAAKREQSSTNLLQEEEMIYLTIVLKKIPQKPRNDKPYRLPIPHSLYSIEGSEICLFVKDGKKGQGHKMSKKKVQSENVPGINKVIGTSKLKSKYESFEAKRKLCGSYDLFLADERILVHLPKLLGKSFFKKKKQPIPVKLTGKNWGAQVERALGATYLYWGGGNTLTIRIARASFTDEQVKENALAALHTALNRIPKKWAGVKALYMKTTDSVALPVYQAAPGSDGLKISA